MTESTLSNPLPDPSPDLSRQTEPGAARPSDLTTTAQAKADMSPILTQLMKDMSEDSRVMVETFYESLPNDVRSLIVANLGTLAQDLTPAMFYKLVRLALRQYEGVFDRERKQISIVGPVNVGKSSLFNALIMPKESKAEVSPVPGTTRLAQAADAGLCTIIDTPGGDEAAGQERRTLALSAARSADSLIVVFDASTGITQGTRELFEEVRRLNKPMTLILNKIDLVGKYRQQVITKAALDLGVSERDLIPVSATRRINLEQIVFSLIRLNPGLLAVTSELVPQYRRQIAARYIAGAAMSAFAVGSTPLPIADFVPLSAIQIGLTLQLGRVFGHQVTWESAKEVLLALGGGFGLREGFRQALKIVPVPIANWLASGLYAAVGTAALGLAAREYWAHGGLGSPVQWAEAADRFRRQIWKAVRSPRFLKRLRNRQDAEQIIEETVEAQAEQL